MSTRTSNRKDREPQARYCYAWTAGDDGLPLSFDVEVLAERTERFAKMGGGMVDVRMVTVRPTRVSMERAEELAMADRLVAEDGLVRREGDVLVVRRSSIHWVG